jgi:tetratricopeptide (TPR) repeat protein
MVTAIGTLLALGLAWFWQGIIADFAGDVERAAICFEQALEFHRDTGYIFPILESMLEVGSNSLMAGRLEQAVAILDESLIMARQAGSETELAYGLLYRGFAALAQKDPALAARFFEEGLRLAQRYQMDRVTLGAIGGLAGVTLALNQSEVAARLLGTVEAARQSGGVGRICQALQVETIASQTTERLGQEAFDMCMKEGSTTAYEDAIDTALAIAVAARGTTRA